MPYTENKDLEPTQEECLRKLSAYFQSHSPKIYCLSTAQLKIFYPKENVPKPSNRDFFFESFVSFKPMKEKLGFYNLMKKAAAVIGASLSALTPQETMAAALVCP